MLSKVEILSESLVIFFPEEVLPFSDGNGHKEPSSEDTGSWPEDEPGLDGDGEWGGDGYDGSFFKLTLTLILGLSSAPESFSEWLLCDCL